MGVSAVALAASMTVGVGNNAAAQQAEAAVAGIEEILVTATKRAKSLMEVPVAVTAVSGTTISNSGVRDIRDLISLVPSLTFQTPGGDTDSSIRIRGIGTSATNPGLEAAVGVVIDGVVRVRTGVALSELGEVERIEVLRGPQGTLFGRNTSAGLVNVITKAPNMEEFEGYVEGTYGNFDYFRLNGSVSGPLVKDKVAGRLEAVIQRRDGFLKEVNEDTDANIMDRAFIRGKIDFQASEDLIVKVSADYTERDEDCCAAPIAVLSPTNAVNGIAAQIGAIGHASPDPFDRLQALTPGRINQEDVTDFGASIEASWTLDFAELVSVTSYREFEAKRGQDFDHSGADFGFIPEDGIIQTFDVFTQEIRLQGEREWLEWLVGVWYASEKVTDLRKFRMGAQITNAFGGPSAFTPAVLAAFTPGDGSIGFAEQKGDDYAIFTHNVFALTDRLDLTVGARLTHNKKSVDVTGTNENPACDVAQQQGGGLDVAIFCLAFWDARFNEAGDSTSRTETEWSGVANLAYQITDSANAYLSYSRGYKSGGFNLDRAGFSTPANPDAEDLAFKEETVDAFEAGLKTDFLDGRVRANLAAFHQVFKDFQSIQFTGTNFFVLSLPKAKTTGVELETTFVPVDGLNLTGAISYTDARYTDNPGNGIFAGQDMELAPEWVVTAAASYVTPIANTSLAAKFHADARYMSSHLLGGIEPQRIQKDYVLVNARIGLMGEDEAWGVDLWARNLFDQNFFRRIFPATFQGGSFSGFLGEPRTWGVAVRSRF
ncbi:MAG: TonB-dependent receptor [Sphingomonadales bacterium]